MVTRPLEEMEADIKSPELVRGLDPEVLEILKKERK